MKKNVLSLFVLVALLLLGLAPVVGAYENSDEDIGSPGTRLAPRPVQYRDYVHNHPHQLPADYVYRTPRVFGPPPSAASSQTDQDKKRDSDNPAMAGNRLRWQVAELVNQITQGSKEPLNDGVRVLVASFVNLNKMYETSSFGRYFGEQVLHELRLAGVEVVDVRMMGGMEVSAGHGEYVLSRDMAELNYVHHAHCVLAGTYSVADDQIFVNARLLENGTGLLLASGSVVFALDPVSAALLQDGDAPMRVAAPVAVPIRRLPAVR